MTQLFIATADTLEACDIAHGTRRIYSAAETHGEADVWRGDDPMSDGVWISPCGNWKTAILDNDLYMRGRNFCYCPFCKSLRQITSTSAASAS